MDQQGAQRLGKPAARPSWSMLFRGASGDWTAAGDRPTTTPIVASSPEGLVFGSLELPASGRAPEARSDTAALAHLRRRLVEAEREQDRCQRIMVTAGHDLRQPLQVLTMVLERFPSPAPRADGLDLLDVARSEIRRLSDGLGDLAHAAFCAEGAAPDLRPFAVSQVMEAVIGRWAHHIRSAPTQLRYVRSRVSVVSDPALLATILDNLLGNALKYASGGRVLFGCRRRGGRLVIEILDTGPGMTEAQLEACRRGCAASSSGSLGLGLYIVHRTVELLGLDLLVASEPGRGSRFAIYLPAA